jgi:hypothetical protein
VLLRSPLHEAWSCLQIANGLNVREAATRLKVSKIALYAAPRVASPADVVGCPDAVRAGRHVR